MRSIFHLLMGMALLASPPSFAQEISADPTFVVQKADKTSKPAKISDVFKVKNEKLPVSVKEKTDKKAREALEKIKVDLDLKGIAAEAAFLDLMKRIGVDYDIDPAFYPFGAEELDFPERALNMKLSNASAARTLDSFCQALGIGWWAEKIDDSVMVHIVKLQGTMGKLDMLAQMGVSLPVLAAQASQLASVDMMLADLGMGLPDKRVKADATAPRDVKLLIEELCKQAGLVFAIDSDVPSTSKVLAFENVPIKTALEALCATAELSMSVSRKGEKVVVTFSKAEKK